MKTYKTQAEFDADVRNGLFEIKDDVKFKFELITTCDIKAYDIIACDINAGNINACDIIADDIKAGNINACNINACNINAGDIIADDIKAGNIIYYAFCCVYNSITCHTYKGRREKSAEPIVLDGTISSSSRKVR